MTYNPNFNDPRVIRRTLKVLGFALSSVSDTNPRELSQEYLSKIYGAHHHKLTKYLKDLTLTKTSSFKRFNSLGRSDNKCYEYKQNVKGIEVLMNNVRGGVSSHVNGLVAIKTRDELSKMSKTERMDYNLMRKTAYVLIKDMNANKHISTHLLDDLKTHVNAQDLALNFARSEYSEQLTQGLIYDDKSSRLWNSIQNLKKPIKHQVLYEHGLIYEYDIASCAPTLLYQSALQVGLKSAKTIEHYLKNKDEIRLKLANDLEIVKDSKPDIKTAKEIITSLFSGAQIHRSIAVKLENDKAKIEFIRQDDFITSLKKDIANCWKILKPVINTRYNQSQSVYHQTRAKKLTSKSKWAYYFFLERQVLEVVREYLEKSSNRCVLEHDGWTCSNQLDKDELTELIKVHTGFDLIIKEEVLSGELIPWCEYW